MKRPQPLATASFAAVLALTILALALRLRGADFLLPSLTQLDELVIPRQVELMREGAERPYADPLYAFYPQLIARLVALLPGEGWRAARPGLPLEEHLAIAASPWVEVRVLSAVLSALLVPGTYLLARRFLGRGASLFAAALVAASLLHAAFAQQARPHAALASFTLAAVLAALLLRRRPGPGSYVLAGAASALAIGALHSGLAALLPLAAAHLLRRREGRAGAVWLLAPAVSIALSIRAFYPFHFQPGTGMLKLERAEGEGSWVFNLSGQPLLLERFDGSGFAAVLEALWTYDPLLLGLAALGLGVLAARSWRRRAALGQERRRDLLVVLSHAVPYAVVIGLYAETWERFVLPLLPYVACLGAYGAARATRPLLERLREPSRGAAGGVLAAAVLAPPGLLVWRLGSVRAAPDTLERAATWIQEHLEPGRDRVLVFPYFDLPLAHSAAARKRDRELGWGSPWARYQLGLPAGEPPGPRWDLLLSHTPARILKEAGSVPEYLRSQGAGHLVLQAGAKGFDPFLGDLRAGLEAKGGPLARFSPETVDPLEPRFLSFRHTADPLENPFFLQLLRARCMGPTLEVWRLE